MRRVSHTKIVRDVTFFVIHYSMLCDTYTIYRQYAGLPKIVAYIHVYCMQLLGVIFTIMRTPSNNIIKC